MFIAFILLLAFIIGQCNDESSETVYEEESYTELTQASEVQRQGLISTNEEDETTLPKQIIEAYSVEIPIIQRDVPEQILKRTAYTLSYNKEIKCPNWVAWYLTRDHSDGEWARSNDYREDYDVPSPRATNDDYKGNSWSRGHMCPAGDNKWDAEAMRESNQLTNMCPQNPSLNSGLWNVIERDCRKWAKKYGGVYIVCGPVFLNTEHETIGENKISVPEAFFKVILRMYPKPAAIGFVVRNNEGKKKRDQFVNSVDEVERITGMDFFSTLPDDIEEEVEAHANLEDWK